MKRPPNLKGRVGGNAVESKGRLRANTWLLARRISQLSILTLFIIGPWFDIWLVKGNLSSSKILDVLPLTDPYVLIQSVFAGNSPESIAITGTLIVLVFYLLVGGRVYCSWVCPINMVTDAAHWLRERTGISGASHLSRSTRYWLLGATFMLALVTGSIAWEMVNPVSMLHRGLIFDLWVGMGMAWLVVAAVFLLDFLVSRRGWCGHLCPVGAFYSLLGFHSIVRVRADARVSCDDCMDCFMVCPEQHVIRPALKGADTGIGPVITSPNCTNCGRCIDVCAKNVFRFGSRFNNFSNDTKSHEHTNHSSGVEVL